MTSEKTSINCPTIYGPIKSRRHGRSLGINLGLVNTKVCTWGCVYCQCGMGERRDIAPVERVQSATEVLSQARQAISTAGHFDSVTFAGNSEPTSHPDFYSIVNGLLELRQSTNAKWILNCLSNGSELDNERVVNACELLDETWIKLDCALDEMFHRLNRPLSRVGAISSHIERITKLKTIYIQTLAWTCPSNSKLTNWTESNQKALLEAYCKLRPKLIHLTTVARAPALSQLQAVTQSELDVFASRVRAQGINVEVFAS